MTTGRSDGRRINLIQGEVYVADEDIIISTMLGSCVAACIRDPIAGIGGMNHFLLPGNEDSGNSGRAESYGVYLMELLINGLLKKGGDRRRMEAKIFGGARTMNSLRDIGGQNGQFAKRFLADEGIRCIAADLGGTRGRRIEYWPVSGRIRRKLMDETVVAAEPVRAAPRMPKVDHGEMELF